MADDPSDWAARQRDKGSMDDERFEREFERMANHFRKNALQGLIGATAMISISPDTDAKGGDFDVKFALELGAAILLNKPIIVVAFPGRVISDGLRRVADAMIELPPDFDMDIEEDRETLAQAIMKAQDALGLKDPE